MKKSCKLITMILFCIFAVSLLPSGVLADSYQAYISADGVNFRKLPTTKNSDILDSFIRGNVITVLDNNKISGTGCSAGWYHINFNGTEGYVCSSYVTTERIEDKYLRPWNTPYKAIVGGALYISSGYISKGQYTSYLKKYNVNPNGYYSVYNHQYQTNIAAPSSEAYSTWKAYDKVGYMEKGDKSFPFVFTIPVYEKMGESYKVEGVSGANLSTSEETDDAFEEMIKDFPESYKPYLRDLHKDHPNWVFKAMITGLDFEPSADIEQKVGAIQNEKMRYKDANGNYIVTELGWYKPTVEATRYYMDPRNWLNETYVFMFEDLSFSESLSEDVVKSILKTKSVIGEYDAIDNMTYSSIFMAAGKAANINPAYLASLSIQEIGSRNVSGAEFTYKDVTYSGLYNFYNLGAYSSEANPTSAGLVFASGGVCTICGNYVPPKVEENEDDPQISIMDPVSETEEPKNEEPKSGENDPVVPTDPVVEPEPTPEVPEVKYGDMSNINVKINGQYASGFTLGTKISDLKAKDALINYDSDDIIKTGTKITTGNATYYAVVYGDLTGDGKINSADLLKVRQYLLGKASLSGAYLEAANITGNGKINSATLLKVRQHLLGKTSISQR